ncbi:MAG: alpha/beta hydrolase [Limnothrix sp.]
MTFTLPAPKLLAATPKINLSYLEWGHGSEPVLLLHGLADNALVWAQLGEALQSKYHVVALDLRGHGASAKPPTNYSCDAYIDDFNRVLEHFGWSQAHVLGHSWGGKLAAIWATRQPEKFKSLILHDPFFNDQIPQWWTVTFPIAYRFLPFLKLMGQFESYEKAVAIAQNLKQFRGWNDWQQAIFQASVEANPDGTWQSKFVRRACDEIFLDVMQTTGISKNLAVPSLFIQPEKGLNRLTWQFKPYRQYLENLSWQIVPGHHWAHIVEPEAFNQAIATFLDSLKKRNNH